VTARRLIVIPLGEITASEAAATVARHFGPSIVDTLDRGALRRSPLKTLARSRRQRYDAAVLLAPNLNQPRLRLTSLVLALPTATARWRIDQRGNRAAFTLANHLTANMLPIARHLAAMVTALGCGELLLSALNSRIKASRQPATRGQPTRILYLRSQLWLGLEGGGSVAHTAGVIRGLQRAGARVHVVSSDRLPGVTAPTQLVRPETWFDGWLRELEDLAYNVPFFVAALRTARRFKPAAIYQRHTAFNCSGALLSRLLRVPLLLEFNSSEVWKGRYWGGLRLVRAAAQVERINLRAADRVIVVSQALSSQLQVAGVSPRKILVNPNGVDPAQFSPAVEGAPIRRRLGIDPEAVVVGFSGTFGVWHGIASLADALPRVLEARPTVRWLLIGDGPLRHVVDAAVQAHGLDNRVHLPGLVPHAEMPAYLAACDVLVSPHGRQADGAEFFGSPTKLFEYMAAGQAIVASAVGQIAQVLEDGRSALLVPPDDPEALSRAIVRLVDDACLRQRLGQTARQVAVERHTWRQNAERVLATLDQRP
jgi:glycosyltransferase involved in cell wall biosynthesis